MDDHDEPNTDGYLITSPTSIGETNYSIAQLKQDNMALFSAKNAFQYYEEDKIIEATVVANDEGGNLYQTLLIRDIDTTKPEGDVMRDQSLVLAVKNTWLTPYFPLGQRIKVNLKGLYIGTYSFVPKIGQPYFTSSDNERLGPILLQLCATNVELVGKPNPDCDECKPVAIDKAWLSQKSHQSPLYYPQLVTLGKGEIKEMMGNNADRADVADENKLTPGAVEPMPKIFAPKELADKGYGVNRTIVSDGMDVTLRTSTQNDIAFTPIEKGTYSFTGMLTIYGQDWQIQLRSIKDLKKLNK